MEESVFHHPEPLPCNYSNILTFLEKASYGVFCFNSMGDLFINSDWGFFGYSWRSFGTDFKKFLQTCNSEYLVGKFGINYREVSGKKLPPHREKNLTILVNFGI